MKKGTKVNLILVETYNVIRKGICCYFITGDLCGKAQFLELQQARERTEIA